MMPTTKTRQTLRLILSYFEKPPLRAEPAVGLVWAPATVGPDPDPWWICLHELGSSWDPSPRPLPNLVGFK